MKKTKKKIVKKKSKQVTAYQKALNDQQMDILLHMVFLN